MTSPQSSNLPAASLQELHNALRNAADSFDTVVAFYRDKLGSVDEEQIIIQLDAAFTTGGDPRAVASILIAAVRRAVRGDLT